MNGLIVKNNSFSSYSVYTNNSVKYKYGISSIKPIDRALSGATTLDQSGTGSNGNEGVLRMPKSPSITWTSLSDCQMQDTHLVMVGVLPLCRSPVSVFYKPSRRGINHWELFNIKILFKYDHKVKRL